MISFMLQKCDGPPKKTYTVISITDHDSDEQHDVSTDMLTSLYW